MVRQIFVSSAHNVMLVLSDTPESLELNLEGHLKLTFYLPEFQLIKTRITCINSLDN